MATTYSVGDVLPTFANTACFYIGPYVVGTDLVIFAGTSLYKSSDYGATWSQAISLGSEFVVGTTSVSNSTDFLAFLGTNQTGSVSNPHFKISTGKPPATWSTDETVLASTTASDFPSSEGGYSVAQNDSGYLALVPAAPGAVMGTKYPRLGWTRRTGANTWTAVTTIAPTYGTTYAMLAPAVFSHGPGTSAVTLIWAELDPNNIAAGGYYEGTAIDGSNGSSNGSGGGAFGRIFSTNWCSNWVRWRGKGWYGFRGSGSTFGLRNIPLGSLTSSVGVVASGDNLTLAGINTTPKLAVDSVADELYVIWSDSTTGKIGYKKATSPGTWESDQFVTLTGSWSSLAIYGAEVIQKPDGSSVLGLAVRGDLPVTQSVHYVEIALTAGAIPGDVGLSGAGALGGEGQKFEGSDRAGAVQLSGSGQLSFSNFVVDSSPLLSLGGSGQLRLWGPSGTLTWSNLTSLPSAKPMARPVSLGTKIYFHGGEQTGTGTGLASTWIYNPSTNAWDTTSAASSTELRTGHFAETYNNKIYVWAGTSSYPNYVFATTVERYDAASNTWTTLGGAIPAGREEGAGGLYNGKLYVFGGTGTNVPSIATNTTYIYDIATETWSTGATMPKSLFECTGAWANGKFYLFGGFSGQTGNLTQNTSIYCYDPVANSWSQVGVTPSNWSIRYNDGCVVVGSKIWFFFFDGNSYSGPYPMAYDTVTGEIHSSTRYPSSTRNGGSGQPGYEQWNDTNAVLHNGELYCIGGNTDQWQTSIAIYQSQPTTRVAKATPGAPDPPTNVIASTPVQVGEDMSIFWTYNGTGTQTKYQVKYKLSGGSEVTATEVTSSLPQGTLNTTGFTVGSYEIWVRTASSAGYSPYSLVAASTYVYDGPEVHSGSVGLSGSGALTGLAVQVGTQGTLGRSGAGALTGFSPEQHAGSVALSGAGSLSGLAAILLLPPTNLTVTPVSPTQLDLSWDAALSATGYDIERDGAVIVENHPSTSYSDVGLVEGSAYTYRVRSVKIVTD